MYVSTQTLLCLILMIMIFTFVWLKRETAALHYDMGRNRRITKRSLILVTSWRKYTVVLDDYRMSLGINSSYV